MGVGLFVLWLFRTVQGGKRMKKRSVKRKKPRNSKCSPAILEVKHGETTPPRTNISPENQWLKDVFPIEIVSFWGTC